MSKQRERERLSSTDQHVRHTLGCAYSLSGVACKVLPPSFDSASRDLRNTRGERSTAQATGLLFAALYSKITLFQEMKPLPARSATHGGGRSTAQGTGLPQIRPHRDDSVSPTRQGSPGEEMCPRRHCGDDYVSPTGQGSPGGNNEGCQESRKPLSNEGCQAHPSSTPPILVVSRGQRLTQTMAVVCRKQRGVPTPPLEHPSHPEG